MCSPMRLQWGLWGDRRGKMKRKDGLDSSRSASNVRRFPAETGLELLSKVVPARGVVHGSAQITIEIV